MDKIPRGVGGFDVVVWRLRIGSRGGGVGAWSPLLIFMTGVIKHSAIVGAALSCEGYEPLRTLEVLRDYFDN